MTFDRGIQANNIINIIIIIIGIIIISIIVVIINIITIIIIIIIIIILSIIIIIIIMSYYFRGNSIPSLFSFHVFASHQAQEMKCTVEVILLDARC